jgi:hypothetical protein
MEDLTQSGSAYAKSEGTVEVIRYNISIYDIPFSKLPDPKRVWLGSPSSALEGLGSPPVASDEQQPDRC